VSVEVPHPGVLPITAGTFKYLRESGGFILFASQKNAIKIPPKFKISDLRKLEIWKKIKFSVLYYLQSSPKIKDTEDIKGKYSQELIQNAAKFET
jgi:hypothetical protein